METPKLTLPDISSEDSFAWGPPTSCPEALSFCLGPMQIYPFEPSTKQERLGPVAEDEADFRLVDSRPVKVNRYQNRFQKRPLVGRRPNNMPQQQQQMNQQNRGTPASQVHNQKQYQQQQTQRQIQWQRNNRQRQLAEWSVEPQQDWTLVDIRQLSALPRLSLNSSQIKFEDIEWRGELRAYDKTMDRILPKNPVPLTDTFSQENAFYWPGTADDAILVNAFDNDSSITVAATDQILACLMSAAQSRISWHLIFHKVNGRLFMDKNNGTSIDLITVDETNKEPPLSDNPTRMNRPAELGAEALKINQNFSQQVFGRQQSTPIQTYLPAPFVEENDVPAAKVYRYRVITLPGQTNGPTPFSKEPLKIVTRAEIDAVSPGTTDSYITIRALNEYNPFRSGKSWKTQLESQKGALIAQETKNNHCKVGKWVAQALIAGCEHLKIGFVTRNTPDCNSRHSILNIQTYKVRDLGIQIGLQQDNAWGIVRGIIDLIMSQPDGRYTLVKDPVKPEIKLYCTSYEVETDLAPEDIINVAEEEEDLDKKTTTLPATEDDRA